MSSNKTSVACVPGAVPGGLQRTSFFNGMFLTQSDLEVEQRFWRMKRRLTNRALGQGVVWGLRVTFDLQAQKLLLNPGYGIDCCGNDLLVQSSFEIPCGQLIDTTDPATLSLLTQATGNELALVLEYVECPEEPRAVHKDACTPASDACEPSRVRETSRLIVAAPPAPQTTPIAAFVDGIEKLRNSMHDASDPLLTEVFPDETPQAAPAAGLHLPFRLAVRLGDSEMDLAADGFLTVENPPHAPSGLGQVITMPADQTREVQLHFELIPDAGFVFYDGAVQVVEPQALNDSWRLAPPFDVQLAWSVRVPLPLTGNAPLHRTSVLFSVSDLAWAPLFGGGDRMRASEFDVSVSLSVEPVPVNPELPLAAFTFRACLEQIGMAGANDALPVEVSDDETLPAGSCLDPLSKGFFLDALQSAKDAPKTVLLAALYGWLTNAFGSDKGYPQGGAVQPAAFDGQRILGTWLYLTAWRLMFGADPAAPHSPEGRQKLAALLDSLMAEWCRGFFYVGPRCDAKFHGAVLGTLTVDKNGLVTGLDLWKRRRWVLTGPLINHWGAQLGLAPLDVVAGRLVDAICCLGLGRTLKGPPVSMALPALGTQSPLATVGAQTVTAPSTGALADAGIFVSDGCYLLFGDEQTIQTLLGQSGLSAVETHTVSWLGFLKRLVEAMASPPAPGPAPNTYAIYAVDGQVGDRPFLMVATDPHVPGAFEKKRAAVKQIVAGLMEDHQETAGFPQLKQQTFPPLAVPAIIDFVTELMNEIPLTALRVELIKQRGFKSADDILKILSDKGHLMTCADVLALGIEAVAGLVSSTAAEHAKNDPVVAGLWQAITEQRTLVDTKARSIWENTATGALQGIAAWITVHPDLVFSRPALVDNPFQELVVKSLQVLELSTTTSVQAMVQCAAARAAGLRT